MIGTLFAALLPDLDEATSTLGKKFFPVSAVLQWVLGHRGLLHSFLVPVFFFLLAAFFQQRELGSALMLGYGSHLLLDMTTVSGIRPFYPFFSLRIRGPLRVGSWAEWLLFLLFGIAVCIKLLFIL
jgi:inner membrane protein